MHILHLIYTGGISGAEKYLLNLLPEINKDGITCELLCVCPDKNVGSLQEYCAEMNARGIKTVLLQSSSRLSFLLTARKISRYLKTKNISVIHSHLFNADLIAFLIKKLFFGKLIILSTKHGYEEKYLVQYGLGNKKIRRNLYYHISKLIIRSIDHNLAISRAISEMYEFLKLGENKMHYIHHGINLPKQTVNQLRLDGRPKIIIVGRLSEMKGHKYLIKALPEIVKHFPDLKLFVLGAGPLKEELIRLAQSLNVLKNVSFVGFVSPNLYISQCQVMVLPSLFEPFGLVYIESFAAGIPVVAFDTPAANEIIENNETGILIEKEDVSALTANIVFLLNSPQERKRITENAYQKFKTYYNVKRMADETVKWYRSVL